MPSTIDDEAFLMFLADIIEEDGELIDPLSMSNDGQPSVTPLKKTSEPAQTIQQTSNKENQEEEHE